MSEQTSPLAKLGTEPTRQRVIEDCVTLIDQQVKAKRGLSGVAIKGAYGTVKRIKKRFVPEVVNALLDDWMGKIEPYYAKWEAGGGGEFHEYLTARSEDVAEDLLVVTDVRAETTKHTTAKKAYKKMRPAAKRDVQAAIPDLAKLIEKHLAADASAPAGESGKADDSAA